LALLAGDDDPSPRQAPLPWEELDPDDDDEPAAELVRPGLDDPAEERGVLERLIALARAAESRASKIACIIRLLDRVREPIIIFTEYRDTLEAIDAALRDRFPVATLHGGLIATQRQRSVDRFTGGDVEVLIATDTGGEGLNLHHRCRLVVTVELPWNPQRLEQRVGRVDRIGQRRRVHAIHLFHAGTVEDEVLARLERRRIHAERALAATPAAPGNAVEAVRLRNSRRSRELADRSRHGEGWAGPACQWQRSTRAIAVYESEYLDASGHVLECSHSGLAIDFAPGVDVSALIAWLHEHPPADRTSPNLAIALEPFARAHLERIASIRRWLGRRGPALEQTSLFDRRAEHRAFVRAAARQRLEAHLAARAARLQGWIDGECLPRQRLIAVWPIRKRS
jgi:hypothetical protein